VVIQRIELFSSQTISPNVKENVINQPDVNINADDNIVFQDNIFIQPDVDIGL
jgi:hypothetical protein